MSPSPSSSPTDVAVIGAGSYGICLAKLLGDKGHRVRLWCRGEELCGELVATRESSVYLPGFPLAPSVEVTTDVSHVVRGARIVLGVTPSHAIREVLGRAAGDLEPGAIVVNASKGLEEGTLKRVDQIYADLFPADVAARAAYLSGPTFAREVASGAPSAIVIAGHDHAAVRVVQDAFSTDRFRVYSSDDVIGVQIGGALKNVVAICAGLSDGLGAGQNARAALITRGLAEIARIGIKLGANPLTFAGLSGMGDLVLTCAGDMSRNRQVGLELARGKKISQIVADMRMVAEGVKTARVARDLARTVGVAAPLTEFIYGVLYEDRPAAEGITDLMTRAPRHERD
jgi:glycerol-3-phosphate dehydrogenase (NAD(P)+)